MPGPFYLLSKKHYNYQSMNVPDMMITYIVCTVQAKEFDYDEALLQQLKPIILYVVMHSFSMCCLAQIHNLQYWHIKMKCPLLGKQHLIF